MEVRTIRKAPARVRRPSAPADPAVVAAPSCARYRTDGNARNPENVRVGRPASRAIRRAMAMRPQPRPGTSARGFRPGLGFPPDPPIPGACAIRRWRSRDDTEAFEDAVHEADAVAAGRQDRNRRASASRARVPRELRGAFRRPDRGGNFRIAGVRRDPRAYPVAGRCGPRGIDGRRDVPLTGARTSLCLDRRTFVAALVPPPGCVRGNARTS